MRPTGGKAVLHGHDVTIGMAVPLDGLGLSATQSRSLGPVYRKIVGILVEALRNCGVRAELGENTLLRRGEGHTADCFAHVAPNDIVEPSTGQKVCGCALRVTQSAVLVQASVPARKPLVRPDAVFLRPSTPYWTQISASEFARSLDAALERTAFENPILT
jgi:lipoate-protein ligase A